MQEFGQVELCIKNIRHLTKSDDEEEVEELECPYLVISSGDSIIFDKLNYSKMGFHTVQQRHFVKLGEERIISIKVYDGDINEEEDRDDDFVAGIKVHTSHILQSNCEHEQFYELGDKDSKLGQILLNIRPIH
ncbi:hypothetical protein CONCODRAFT_68021 [Conidiobolus coronatus NRRL 28638]|uniref:C2 domain-containing protein n=1 Tax=Conidiobolus coronatus (strain ATCC 28846 / CBS 209.66 / NRRL 28638) TaxID=796925 RepID=A0A137PFN8_CONC2|nr:hypothetical protein CONCODRAFT_68021 [Conidiobolus coronatus NRRL 28638]|eukprot:KXN73802.1 hypothetical protein CONCODRAFT_68021 [Conidiobolus coronatus NRRL 28638]